MKTKILFTASTFLIGSQFTFAQYFISASEIANRNDSIVRSILTEKYFVPSNNYEIVPGLLYSGNGYIATLPDYLGLGDNPGIHPYAHWESEATASIDLTTKPVRRGYQPGRLNYLD